MSSNSEPDLIELTVETVCAYVSNNPLPASELPGFLKSIYDSIAQVGNVATVGDTKLDRPAPAVSIKKSITDEYLICLEDGERYKSLKRHLASKYGLTPNEYRAKWNLPSDYPMVAPAYSKARSALALNLGLGRRAAVETPEPVKAEPAPAMEAVKAPRGKVAKAA